MKRILVTGVGGPAGRSVSTMLLERHHEVIGVDLRQIEQPAFPFYTVPAAHDPNMLATVYEIARRERVDLIIPTVSEELTVFARSWTWGFSFPAVISPATAVEIADDKYRTASVLHNHSVPVPHFGLPSQFSSADDLAERIGWPCITKPRVGRGGREVAIHEAADWIKIATLEDDYIIQEFAAGTDYAPNLCALPSEKSVVIVLEKTELKEGLVGNARSVVRVEAPDVASVALSAAQAVGLQGPLDIDIRRRADGQPVVLEINARFGANIRFAPEVMDAALRFYGVAE